MDAPIDRLRGVDTKLSAKFNRLDVTTVRDLLYLFPRRHLEYANIVKISQLVPGLECTVIGTVWEAHQVSKGFKGKRKDTEAVLSDETGNLKVLWFGQGYLARTLKPGTRLAISGKVDVFAGQLLFEGPDYDLLDSAPAPINTGRLVPVADRSALAAALDELVNDAALRARYGAAGRERALALYDEKAVIARQLGLLGLAD